MLADIRSLSCQGGRVSLHTVCLSQVLEPGGALQSIQGLCSPRLQPLSAHKGISAAVRASHKSPGASHPAQLHGGKTASEHGPTGSRRAAVASRHTASHAPACEQLSTQSPLSNSWELAHAVCAGSTHNWVHARPRPASRVHDRNLTCCRCMHSLQFTKRCNPPSKLQMLVH